MPGTALSWHGRLGRVVPVCRDRTFYSSPLTDQRLPRSERLHGRTTFLWLSRQRPGVWVGGVRVVAVPNGLPVCRLGVSTPRILGPAVTRVRLRRLVREAFRTSKPELPAGFDLLVRLRPGCPVTLAEMRRGLVAAVGQSGQKGTSPATLPRP